jgi:hypothetical protein
MARLKAGAGAPVKRPGIDLTLPNVARLYVDQRTPSTCISDVKQHLPKPGDKNARCRRRNAWINQQPRAERVTPRGKSRVRRNFGSRGSELSVHPVRQF